jgi:hypothetical protein
MTRPARPSLTYKGRSIGLMAVVAAQLVVGFIHVIFGVWLLSAQISPFAEVVTSSSPIIYSIYTVIFSFLTLAFAVPLWIQKRVGWVGTVAVLLFVVAADSLTLLNLPSVPGIPKLAGLGEITYSILILVYLMQGYIRATYRIYPPQKHEKKLHQVFVEAHISSLNQKTPNDAQVSLMLNPARPKLLLCRVRCLIV